MKRMIIVVVGLILVGCGGADVPANTPADSPAVDTSVPVEDVVEVEPTDEPKAANAHKDILDAFMAAGLDGADAVVMEADDYGMGPFVCDGQQFPLLITRPDEEDAFGRLFICDDGADADKLAEYYTSIGESTAMLASHVFNDGRIVMQASASMERATWDQYEAILAK